MTLAKSAKDNEEGREGGGRYRARRRKGAQQVFLSCAMQLV